MYGVDMFKEYDKVAKIKPGWNEVLKKYDSAGLFSMRIQHCHRFLWKEMTEKSLIYADEVADIFVKNVKRNQYLIEKYPDVKLVIPDPDESEK